MTEMLLDKLKHTLEPSLSLDEAVELLASADAALESALFACAGRVRARMVGNKVYYRGLIEYSNICGKNCYYCGIRADHAKIERYQMSQTEVLEACQFAYQQGYASVVIQSGELVAASFVEKICSILDKIQETFGDGLRVTLSCGEQSEETLALWRAKGASRYLLRIETSNEELYRKLHPQDGHHLFAERLACLATLRKLGYQVGSGIMIGLPQQSLRDIAQDLFFLRDIDIDMVGMGPYVAHAMTPLEKQRDTLLPAERRLQLGLRSVAILRLLMGRVNIAAATALQALDPVGREKALQVGANVIMPNLTPTKYRKDYALYENKPCVDEDRELCAGCLQKRIQSIGQEVALHEPGDSLHFQQRKNHPAD